MLDRWSPLLASGCFALALSHEAHAASAITAAAITAGRLYVLGTTDRPGTRVALDGAFTTESDDQGKFQFELLHYPAGCVVRATIGDRIVQAKVSGCGEICEPASQADARPPSRPDPVRAGAPAASSVAPAPAQGMLHSGSKTPLSTGTIAALELAPRPPSVELIPRPIPHPPLPPLRPDVRALLAARTPQPEPHARPSPARAKPSPDMRLNKPEAPAEPPPVELPDAPERSDIY